MIGQHIYSRCLEGYFSKSGVNADSTTVTISMDMFARKEQAKRIARECESISVLEDARPVPSEVQGAYRGVLKIRRLNRQITVVCRSYRLHSEQGSSGSGESRDFTYASNYILAGEDREKFLENPEYFLNIQDFEPYPSVMQRIRESRMQGNNGRIEANEEYSLFRSQCRKAVPDIFQQAGFNRELFIDYISSIIHRVSGSHYQKNEKVLVILPQKYNMPWEKSGGNAYAEEVLAATMKLLPMCVREQLSANTGGLHEPSASVLEGYQLVFMEPGNTKEWEKSEYSVIDLEQKTSYVPENTDRKYAEFLWEHLSEPEVRKNFERQYDTIFDEEKTGEEDHGTEKFALVLQLLDEEKTNFADAAIRRHLLLELVYYCQKHWSKYGIEKTAKILEKEIQEPGYDKEVEKCLRELLEQEKCPEELRMYCITILMQDILSGEGAQESIQWICNQIEERDSVVLKKFSEANDYVEANTNTAWHEKKSLTEFYMNICRNPEISEEDKGKREVLSILSKWYFEFLEQNDWENSSMVVRILSEQLENVGLGQERRKEVYEDLLYLLFFGQGEGRKPIVEIIKNEERTFSSNPQNLILFRECCARQMQEEDIHINEDVIWQITYLAVSGDETYLQEQWKVLHGKFVQRFAGSNSQEMFRGIRENFFGWVNNIHDDEKLQLLYDAMAVAEINNLKYGVPYYNPEFSEFCKLTELLIVNGRERQAADLLYERYMTAEKLENKKSLFMQMSQTQRWQMLILSTVYHDHDKLLRTARTSFLDQREQFLQVTKSLELTNEEAETAVEIYLESLSKIESLPELCHIYRNELPEIKIISEKNNFNDHVSTELKKMMEQCDASQGTELNIGDVLFLKEQGFLPFDGEKWKYLDVISSLYQAEPCCYTEDFIRIRSKIIQETGNGLKRSYLDALTKKRRALSNVQGAEELLGNIVLLEGQIRQDMLDDDKFSLEEAAREILGGNGKKEQLLTALRLLNIIQNYGYQRDYGAYDCEHVKNQLLNVILKMAKANPKIFENAQIVRLYRKIDRDNRKLLEGKGFRKCLQELSGEWQSQYGIREEKSVAEKVLPKVMGVVFFLLGVGLEVLFYYQYGKIDIKITLLIGMILTAVGIIGDVVVMIYMLFHLDER